MTENLFIRAVFIFIICFVGYMHSYWGSTMHNRPIIIGTLVGLLFGDLTTGIIVGSAVELAFLGAVPIGASNPPDMCSGAAVATAFVIMAGAEPGMAVTVAIPIASLVALFDNVLMMFVLTWIGHLCDKAAEEGNYKRIETLTRVGSIGNKLILALVVAVGFYFGSPAIEAFINWVPAWFSHGMDVVASILPALGIAMLARMIIAKDNWGYLIIGFLISAYLGVPTLGVALLGIAIVSILFYRDWKGNKKEVADDDNEF